MCVLLIALKTHPAYKLILLANRDEYYERPTSSAAFWDEAPFLLAGKDLQGGGTWLGITRNGRIAAITNYRDPASVNKNAPSRGTLVSNFLVGQESTGGYLERVKREADGFNGFSLIIGDKDQLCWYSNRSLGVHRLSSGIHGLSNHLLDTPWPKVVCGKDALTRLLSGQRAPSLEELFHILADRTVPDDASLPHTGVELEWERILSPIFIVSPTYGTRSSTVLLIDVQDRVTFVEKTFDSDPDHPTSVEYKFRVVP
ncbi:MAG: NRDE family protein [Deltaproteobacteria bacterium]|nr:NRDE family protein [Deltaproteobacteria bacterium]MBW2341625.1 NRDE family protein [Deltaproteobacteria bacterium]